MEVHQAFTGFFQSNRHSRESVVMVVVVVVGQTRLGMWIQWVKGLGIKKKQQMGREGGSAATPTTTRN
jgi:hypothetical protein